MRHSAACRPRRTSEAADGCAWQDRLPTLRCVDVDEARRIADAELARWNSTLTPNRLTSPHGTSHDPGDEYVVFDVDPHSRAWIVHFGTRRWLETRSISDAVVGTCSLGIDRATGELHVYGSAEFAKFDAWLDVPPG